MAIKVEIVTNNQLIEVCADDTVIYKGRSESV